MRGLLLGAVLGCWIGSVSGSLQAQSSSILALEQPSPCKSPFRKGDRLEIRDTGREPAESVRQIIVLNVKWWPWVEVQTPTGKNWVNFANVSVARFTKPPE